MTTQAELRMLLVKFNTVSLFTDTLDALNRFRTFSAWFSDDTLMVEPAAHAFGELAKRLAETETAVNAIASDIRLAKLDDLPVRWGDVEGPTAHHVVVRFAAQVVMAFAHSLSIEDRAQLYGAKFYSWLAERLATVPDFGKLSENWTAVRESLNAIETDDTIAIMDRLEQEKLRTQKALTGQTAPGTATGGKQSSSVPQSPPAGSLADQTTVEARAIALLYPHFKTTGKLMRMEDLVIATGASRTTLYDIEGIKSTRKAIKAQLKVGLERKGFVTTDGGVEAYHEDEEVDLD